MVYIRLNPTILSHLHTSILSQYSSTIIHLENSQYMTYKKFKSLSLSLNISLHKYLTRNDIISQIDFNKLIQLSKRTPEQRRFIQNLKHKHQMRIMNNFSIFNQQSGNIQCNNNKNTINSQLYYYGNKNTSQSSQNNNIKQLTDSVSFGITFIFSFFMAGLTGYYFAQYFFRLQLIGCLIVSIVFIFTTIFIQTWLYIIKQTKVNAKLKEDRKKNQDGVYGKWKSSINVNGMNNQKYMKKQNELLGKNGKVKKQ